MPADVQLITNSSASPLQVWIEPWVEYVEIPPNAIAEFRASSEVDGKLEIVPGESPVVYGWGGSSLQVFVAGNQIWTSYAPAPPTPKALGMRGMIDLLFGNGT